MLSRRQAAIAAENQQNQRTHSRTLDDQAEDTMKTNPRPAGACQRLRRADDAQTRRESRAETEDISSPPPAADPLSRGARDRRSQRRSANLLLMSSASLLLVASCLALAADARVTFEKMTNRDYSGVPYYSVQNVSLFECLGWCKEETMCVSAVFSFVVNPFAALQETTCTLQNETQARQGAYVRQMPAGDQMTVVAQPQKATNLYFFNKVELQTEAVCSRLWAFERFPNRRLRQRDHPSFHAASKEACQAACMNEQRFVCRSLEYNYITQQCSLNGYDRRSPLIVHLAQQAASNQHSSHDLLEAPGTDYFENACLLGEDICTESRIYDYAKIGMPLHRIAHFVELNYYPDKEMLVKSQAGCVRACTIEHEFICRSILYRSSFKQGQPNCALYHLDQRTFPDGADTFMSHHMQPLLDSGETSAVYLEAVCNDTIAAPIGGPSTITLPPTSMTIVPSATTPGGIIIHTSGGGGGGGGNSGYGGPANHSSTASSEDRFMASTSTLSPVNMLVTSAASSTTMRLPGTTFLPSSSQMPANIQIPDLGGPQRVSVPSHIILEGSSPSSISRDQTMATVSRPAGNNEPFPNRLTIRPAPQPQLILEPSPPSSGMISNQNGANTNHDQNCDAHGFCYDVALKCTDTKMIVNVKTQRPFFGRIYALGRSETCNSHIKNQNQFQLDMYLHGQECNTQSASGTYTNTIVLQHHNVVLTKADKVYHVRCTYETASRNVTLDMLPVKDMFEVDMNKESPETISITANTEAPLPKISILTLDGREASTVRIGDRLTFRIEIPSDTPYGIFARSCFAIAKDARSTFEIIDESGCPVDHTIFPGFKTTLGNENALESTYEAFRFTESYGVIFQCNVKYCIGKCEPVNCGIGHSSVDSYGRRKRSIGASKEGPQHGKPRGDDMTLSREIVVLDLKEKERQDSQGGGNNNNSDDQNSDAVTTTPAMTSQRAQPLRSNHGKQPPTASSSSPEADYSTSGDAFGGGGTKHCLSSQSLLVLIFSIGLFFVLYVCLVAYFFARRDPKISPIKHQYH